MKITIDTNKISTYTKLGLVIGNLDPRGEDGVLDLEGPIRTVDTLEDAEEGCEANQCVCLVIPIRLPVERPRMRDVDPKSDLGI